jgi:site-specific recombinase XerD
MVPCIYTGITMEENVQISLTKLREEMFKILPRLKDDEELTVTFEGKAAYVIRKVPRNRGAKIRESLSKCPKLDLTFEEMMAFKNEGRK